jgi:hypothetical protein
VRVEISDADRAAIRECLREAQEGIQRCAEALVAQFREQDRDRGILGEPRTPETTRDVPSDTV